MPQINRMIDSRTQNWRWFPRVLCRAKNYDRVGLTYSSCPVVHSVIFGEEQNCGHRTDPSKKEQYQNHTRNAARP